MPKIAYKLFRQRKDGTLGPLFINRRLKVVPKKWYKAEAHRTKGYAFRPGWHTCAKPEAPHLSKKNRVWCKVEITGVKEFERPAAQGGLWYLANRMRVLKIMS